MKYRDQVSKVLSIRIAMLVGECETVLEFADRLNAHPNTIYYWTSEKSTPSADALADICRVFRVRADWLLGLSDDPGREIQKNRRTE